MSFRSKLSSKVKEGEPMKTSKTNFRFLAASIGITAPLLMFAPGLEGLSRAGTVVVTPSNMDNWTLNTFDDYGNIVATGGTAQITSDPGGASPLFPGNTGSVQLETPNVPNPLNPPPEGYGGDGAAALATEQFDGTLLSSITSLSYSAFDVTNNGQQFPYLAISINTGNVDNSGDAGALANTLDTLFFEPPFQQPLTGNPSLFDQGPTVPNQWQTWNANNLLVGGFWDNDGIADPGVAEGGNPGVMPLSTFLTDFPDATIENGGLPELGGIALQVGFGSSTDNYDGYVDQFTLGTTSGSTTYDFEPAAVPEPASFGLLGIGALALLRRRRRAPQ